MAKMVLT